jgi:hypothetical protein
MTELMSGLEILNACRLLFPSVATIENGFLEKIDVKDVKKAFRKTALTVHPDRSRVLGKDREELLPLFQEVSSAYDTLKAFMSERGVDTDEIQGRTTGKPRAKTAGPAGYTQDSPQDHYYHGIMPPRELRLAEFLYYSGMISWRTLIGAVVWQKRQRPLFGQIARQWNYLSDEEIRYILRQKTWREKFGEYALRQGYLSHRQLLAVVGRQKQLQPRIGIHFKYQGLFSEFQLDRLVRRNGCHNFENR